MNPHPARKPSLYEQSMALPEGLIGETINGQLRTQLRSRVVKKLVPVQTEVHRA